MADKRIHELDELITPVSTDLLLLEQSSSNVDKKVKLENLVSNDVIAQSVSTWLDNHPEATTTVEDGSITVPKLASDVVTALANKAEIDGYYDEMAVGSAEQLLSNTYEEDTDPYLFRTSGGSLEIGDRVYEDAIVGASVAWNQLIQNGNFESTTGWRIGISSTSGWKSASASNNVLHLVSVSNQQSFVNITQTVGVSATHVYLLNFDVKGSKTSYFAASVGTSSGGGTFPSVQYQANVWTHGSCIAKVNTYTDGVLYIRPKNSQDEEEVDIYLKNIYLCDLTIMFGSTIADYVYTLERSEAGSGIAWLKANGFFTKNYYPFNAGGIESTKTSAKKVTGFNQWDEVWEVGRISTSTGANIDSTSAIRSKNFCKIMPNTTYYVKSAKNLIVDVYDENKAFIQWVIWGNENRTITTPSNAAYFKLCTAENTGNTYANDICINLHWDGERDGEYEAYEEHTYPLGNDELRGLFKLSNGKIYADGDVKTSDGTITRKWLVYTITGTETSDWYDNTSSVYSYHYGGNITFPIEYRNLIKSAENLEGITDKNYKIKFANEDKCVYSTNGVRLTIIDDSCTTKQEWLTAITGMTLLLGLATPTTESADPYTNPQLVDNWGTEEFVDTREVPVPVGHESRYLPDLKAKLESAPSNPSTNGKYFLQYQNGEATYVPVPSEVPQTPSEDGTYVLKATVASGVATLSWVVEE